MTVKVTDECTLSDAYIEIPLMLFGGVCIYAVDWTAFSILI
jgi:hypothetical protein